MDFEIKRTPEQGHTVACQAKALITVIEGTRDLEGMTPYWFRGEAQMNFLSQADGLLKSGSTECLCDPL